MHIAINAEAEGKEQTNNLFRLFIVENALLRKSVQVQNNHINTLRTKELNLAEVEHNDHMAKIQELIDSLRSRDVEILDLQNKLMLQAREYDQKMHSLADDARIVTSKLKEELSAKDDHITGLQLRESVLQQQIIELSTQSRGNEYRSSIEKMEEQVAQLDIAKSTLEKTLELERIQFEDMQNKLDIRNTQVQQLQVELEVQRSSLFTEKYIDEDTSDLKIRNNELQFEMEKALNLNHELDQKLRDTVTAIDSLLTKVQGTDMEKKIYKLYSIATNGKAQADSPESVLFETKLTSPDDHDRSTASLLSQLSQKGGRIDALDLSTTSLVFKEQKQLLDTSMNTSGEFHRVDYTMKCVETAVSATSMEKEYEFSATRDRLDAQILSLEQELERTSIALREKETMETQLLEEIKMLQKSEQSLGNQVGMLKIELSHKIPELENLKKIVQTLNTESLQMRNMLQDTGNELLQSRARESNAIEQVEILRHQLVTESQYLKSSSDVEQLRQQVSLLNQEKIGFEEKWFELNNQVEQSEELIQKLKQQVIKLRSREGTFVIQQSELERRLAKVIDEKQEQEIKVNVLQHELYMLNTKYSVVENDLKSMEIDRVAVFSEHERLRQNVIEKQELIDILEKNRPSSEKSTSKEMLEEIVAQYKIEKENFITRMETLNIENSSLRRDLMSLRENMRPTPSSPLQAKRPNMKIYQDGNNASPITPTEASGKLRQKPPPLSLVRSMNNKSYSPSRMR